MLKKVLLTSLSVGILFVGCADSYPEKVEDVAMAVCKEAKALNWDGLTKYASADGIKFTSNMKDRTERKGADKMKAYMDEISCSLKKKYEVKDNRTRVDLEGMNMKLVKEEGKWKFRNFM